MTDYEITITIDTNDADYRTEVSKISEEELELIKPLIAAIKKFEPYVGVIPNTDREWRHGSNYPQGECLREDLGEKSAIEYYGFPEETHDLFEGFCPCDEHGWHTVESIYVCPWVDRQKDQLL